MNVLLSSNFLQRGIPITKAQYPISQIDEDAAHKKRVRAELKAVGLSKTNLSSSEAQYIHKVIHPKERIGGAVFGYGPDGFAMLVATDRRAIYLDTKPMFVKKDEVTYTVVSGVKYEHAGFGSTVTLHTKVKDYKLRTRNKIAAQNFVEFIETRSIEQKLSWEQP